MYRKLYNCHDCWNIYNSIQIICTKQKQENMKCVGKCCPELCVSSGLKNKYIYSFQEKEIGNLLKPWKSISLLLTSLPRQIYQPAQEGVKLWLHPLFACLVIKRGIMAALWTHCHNVISFNTVAQEGEDERTLLPCMAAWGLVMIWPYVFITS